VKKQKKDLGNFLIEFKLILGRELLHHHVCSMLDWLTIAITETSLVLSMKSIIGVLVGR